MGKKGSRTQTQPQSADDAPSLYDHPNILPQHSHVCLLVAMGTSVHKAVDVAGVKYSTFFAELNRNTDLQDNYSRARDAQADYFADSIIEIADDTETDPQAVRNRINARIWVAGKQKPKRYGDTKNINLSGDIGLYPQLTDDQVYKRLSQVARKAGYVLLKRDDYARVSHLLPGPDGAIDCPVITDTRDYKGGDHSPDITQNKGNSVTQCVKDCVSA